jgi:hypothetical protein
MEILDELEGGARGVYSGVSDYQPTAQVLSQHKLRQLPLFTLQQLQVWSCPCFTCPFPSQSMIGDNRTATTISDIRISVVTVLWCLVQALGYLSVNDTFDLNIVIRTAVFVDQPSGTSHLATSSSSSDGSSASSSSSRRVMTVGAGGAVTIQSDPESEFAEMQLKAEKILSAVAFTQQQQQQQQQVPVRLLQQEQPGQQQVAVGVVHQQPREQEEQQEAQPRCMVRR